MAFYWESEMFNKLYSSIEYGRDMEKDILMKVHIIYILNGE